MKKMEEKIAFQASQGYYWLSGQGGVDIGDGRRFQFASDCLAWRNANGLEGDARYVPLASAPEQEARGRSQYFQEEDDDD